jgi:hypothetical protein
MANATQQQGSKEHEVQAFDNLCLKQIKFISPFENAHQEQQYNYNRP